MPDIVDVSQYDLPAGALLEAISVDNAAGARSRLLARLRDHQEKSRAALEEWRDLFDRLFEEAVRRDFNSRFLVQWVAALLEKERAALERLYPMMDKLQQKLDERGDRIDAEARELFQESIDTAFDWITPYQTLCTKLLKLASERRIAAGGLLRARPVEGDIDHETLTREIVARFPKILAALAN
jgi:hypothetical protein